MTPPRFVTPARAALLSIAALAVGCPSKDAEQKAGFEPPRPVEPEEASSGPLQTFRLSEDSLIGFELPAREARPSGRFSPVSGELELDVHDLRRFYGTLSVDLSALWLEDDSSGTRAQTARAWLELGSDVEPARRNRLSRASFTIRRAENPSARSAWAGKPDTPRSAARERGGPEGKPGEVRRVKLEVLGDLELHGVRTPQRVPAELSFHYDEAPKPSTMPTSLRIRSLGTVSVSLADHDIAPRDEAGRLLARDLPLLGRSVGKNARLTAELLAHWVSHSASAREPARK